MPPRYDAASRNRNSAITRARPLLDKVTRFGVRRRWRIALESGSGVRRAAGRFAANLAPNWIRRPSVAAHRAFPISTWTDHAVATPRDLQPEVEIAHEGVPASLHRAAAIFRLVPCKSCRPALENPPGDRLFCDPKTPLRRERAEPADGFSAYARSLAQVPIAKELLTSRSSGYQ